MMPIDWNAAVNVMRDALPPTHFKNWVEPMRVVHCENDRIILSVPSQFHGDWVRDNYSEQITIALRNTCGRQLSLEFEVTEENVSAAWADIPEPVVVNRPTLRIVTPEEAPPPRTAPNTPPFKHPFYELDSNHVAFQCAEHFIASSTPGLNPLVIEGGVGMGKTHLLSHIAKGLFEQNPNYRIYYTTTESFLSEMHQSYQTRTNREFRKKYWESIDVLLFDEAHMIPKKERMQEELLHAFNEIIARNGRVIFATAKSFSKLDDIIAPLKSRLQAGVSAEIRHPSFDDRTRLLAQFALHQELSLDDLTLRSMADKGNKDNRDLIGTLLRAHLHAQLSNRTLDANYLSEFGFANDTKRETITLSEIVGLVEHNFGVEREDLVSKCRKSSLNWARQVAMYLARSYTQLSMEDIGKHFGRNHATVVHAYQKVKETMELQPTRRYEVQHLKCKLQNRAPKSHVPF